MPLELVPISEIVIRDRVRRDVGDVSSLAASIATIGLLHPPVLNSQRELIAGTRRLAAVADLGWDEIPCNVAESLDDALAALQAERDENTCRESLSPSELVQIGRKIEVLEKPKAAGRKSEGGKSGGKASGKLPEALKGDTRDKVGKALGTSGKTYEKAKQVAEAAENDPEKFGDLPAKMDAESVNAAHKELKNRKSASAEIVPPTAVDDWGIPIQPHAAEAFAAVPKFKELLAAIQAAQRLFNQVANTPGGKFLTLPDVSSYRRGKKGEDGEYADRFVHEGLERAYHQTKTATPRHTVCPYRYADGAHPEKCRTCLGLNWTPELSTTTPPVCIERARAAHGVEERE